jgi:hypothetical protein
VKPAAEMGSVLLPVVAFLFQLAHSPVHEVQWTFRRIGFKRAPDQLL